MAVGKGSMERAAKAAGTDAAGNVTGNKEKTPARRMKNSGMLERAAKPNERFGIGDAMPFYYF